jgi:alanine racemase
MLQSYVTVNLTALQDNFLTFQARNPGKLIVPVIKSDAYGHGLPETARALVAVGATTVAIFNLHEAEILRKSGYEHEIWSLEGALPAEIGTPASLTTTLALWNWETAQALSDYAVTHGRTFRVHLKLDTGMGRLGFLPEEIPALWPRLEALPGLNFTGCFSHLATADIPGAELTDRQVQAFQQALAVLPPSVFQRHLCATAGLQHHLAPELPCGRLGIGLYGCCPDQTERDDELQPALEFGSQVISVKELPAGRTVSYGATYELPAPARLAVVPVGYADGYPRCLGNRACVLIGGKRCPIRGRICMGMLMADVTECGDVRPGDEVVLIGRQGEAEIRIEELAELAGTITYEIFCNLGKHPVRYHSA